MLDVAVPAFDDPTRVVLEQVNWSVTAGEYWVVAGLHGTGKSDLLMLLAGLIGPVAGVYRFCNHQMPIIDEATLQTRLRLGLVFDGGRLFNQLTVGENIALPIRYHQVLPPQETKTRVETLLRLTQLDQCAELMPAALSRHWQKRVGLARALALQPEVLLIDNPLSGLDAPHAQWWLSFLDELSVGHNLLGGKPVTLIVTSETLVPWRGHARQVALVTSKRLIVLGNWAKIAEITDVKLKTILAELGG